MTGAGTAGRYLTVRATCPCCEQMVACEEGCTFLDDDRNGAEEMGLAREALADFAEKAIVRLESALAAMTADRDSWCEQADDRVNDCLRALDRAGAAEKALAESVQRCREYEQALHGEQGRAAELEVAEKYFERLRAVIRERHDMLCTTRLNHAPECLLYEIEDERAREAKE